MKKVIKYGCYALLAIAVYLLWYAFLAFAQWELNPEKWTLATRAMLPIWGTISSAALIAANEIN